MTIREPDFHHGFRRDVHRRRAAMLVPPVKVTSYTYNPKMSDDEVVSYFVGLIFVSLPGAMRGPPEEDATPEQLALAARVDAYMVAHHDRKKTIAERAESFERDIVRIFRESTDIR